MGFDGNEGERRRRGGGGGEVQPEVARPALHKQSKGGGEPGREEEDRGGRRKVWKRRRWRAVRSPVGGRRRCCRWRWAGGDGEVSGETRERSGLGVVVSFVNKIFYALIIINKF